MWSMDVERYSEEPGVKVIISRFMKTDLQEVHVPRMSYGLLYEYIGVSC